MKKSRVCYSGIPIEGGHQLLAASISGKMDQTLDMVLDSLVGGPSAKNSEEQR
jgi:hypothetical protein